MLMVCKHVLAFALCPEVVDVTGLMPQYGSIELHLSMDETMGTVFLAMA